ncbi:CRISPR-associated protein [uncultured Leptotrichia sp.]|uniref:type III-A CRISPR-associated CARF protein Csm6 n=1 Tax=uncultured Leptotrichia sp. TaxID=159271 RepID=UPI0025E16F86|nr:CRISPR-associated protein [uncultured Leptotrichia sp.]
MDKNIDQNKERVLLTFAGNSDPTRNNYDGPMLHICRYYRPEKIYLVLTSEMQKRNENKIYEKAIKESLTDYNPIFEYINTDINDAHLFDIYFNKINETFNKIKLEHPNAEVLVNVTSGTVQIISNLVMYIVDAVNINIIPVQVESPEGKGNTSKVVNDNYKVNDEKENNFDNIEEFGRNRIIFPDLRQYSRLLAKNQIKELLKKYEYLTCLELLKRDIFQENSKLNGLLNFANDRRHLKGLKSNGKLKSLNDKKFDKFYYYSRNETNENKVKEWYKIVDYFALANIKQKSGDIAGYTIMLEPLIVNIYLSILRDVLGKKLSDLFSEKRKEEEFSYKTDILKIKKYDGLKEKIEDELNKVLKDSIFVSNKVLIAVIKYFIEKDNRATLKKMDLNDFIDFSETLSKIKEVRNMIAHSLKTINRDDFNSEAKVGIDTVNSKIINFFKKYYTDFGYKESMVYVYDEINKIANEILETEK